MAWSSFRVLWEDRSSTSGTGRVGREPFMDTLDMEAMLTFLQHLNTLSLLKFRQANSTLCFNSCKLKVRGVDKGRSSYSGGSSCLKVRLVVVGSLKGWPEKATDCNVKRESTDESWAEKDKEDRCVGLEVTRVGVRLPSTTMGVTSWSYRGQWWSYYLSY